MLGPKKNKAYCSVFVFCWGISTAICDLVLYLLFEGLKILIDDGVIPFQYLITAVAMQDYSISETGSQFIFPKWKIQTKTHAFVLRFLELVF